MSHPVDLLLHSLQQAQSNGDPNAQFCALTTLDEEGFPVSRIVTIREMAHAGIEIYINEQSPKVEHLRSNPNYELLFFWPSLIRQFRVRGGYEIYPSEAQRRSWSDKPYAGKLYDLFQSSEQQQSSVMPSREAYLDRAGKLKQRHPQTDNLEMPAELVALRFLPDYIESWVASMEDRLHDRRLFRLLEGNWTEQVLVP